MRFRSTTFPSTANSTYVVFIQRSRTLLTPAIGPSGVAGFRSCRNGGA